ncbi:molybdopterin molybdotransferase MoeA [Coralliovum pocilloporae]|uniref:molybdopterin molybdotransferase MoeA n=1 Tax=Coralliovum pocilloporae TaxID=3066369 RepID=UPI003307082F
MALMPVAEALDRLLANVRRKDAEHLPLHNAYRRVLASDLKARRTQPPFAASAMDGFAVRSEDMIEAPSELTIIGEAPAGHGFDGTVGVGEAVRIFTGAPLPNGADSVLIQENADYAKGRQTLKALEPVKPGQHVRPAGLDFTEGQTLLAESCVIGPGELALAASMDYAQIPVVRKPLVAVLATGDELVAPGTPRRDDQIVASNSFGVAALVRDNGGDVLDLGIAADTVEAIGSAIKQALEAGADLIVTLGGASVGDHDLVQTVLKDHGMSLDFWRIAMRPGKPLMAGSIDSTHILGLPGNPVSSMVCGLLFMRPLIRTLAGLSLDDISDVDAVLGADLPENDQRQDYIRATLSQGPDGHLTATPFAKQDSSMLARLVQSDCLIIRPPFAEAVKTGDVCKILKL